METKLNKIMKKVINSIFICNNSFGNDLPPFPPFLFPFFFDIFLYSLLYEL